MDLKTIGVTGPDGSIGSSLVARGMLPLSFDITKPNEYCIPASVKYVIHCAAITDVDYCEEHYSEALDVNYRAVLSLLEYCELRGIRFIFISSDHVFRDKFFFLKPRENDIPNPLNAYGFTKMAAESILSAFNDAKIVRTSVIFSNKHLPVESQEIVQEVTNVIKKTFMYVEDFVDCLIYYVENWERMPKRLHISGTERISWYQFMKYTREMWGYFGTIFPRNYFTNTGFTPRPKNSGLDVSLAKKLGVPVKSYVQGVERWYKDNVEFCFPDSPRI